MRLRTNQTIAAPRHPRDWTWADPIPLFITTVCLIAGFEVIAQNTGFAGLGGWSARLHAGAIIWILTLVLVVRRKMDTLVDHREEVKETVRMCLELNTTLETVAALERNMRTVGTTRGPVLQTYCNKVLKEAVEMSSNAASRNRILVKDHHFATVEDVLGAFQTGARREYRCVWSILGTEEAYNEHWKEYILNLLNINEKESQKIRVFVLVVVDDFKALERENIRTICGFCHQNQYAFEYSVISSIRYHKRLIDANLGTNYGDFGIFGDSLMYRTIDEDIQTGEFTEDRDLIESYQQFHRDTMAARDELKAKQFIGSWLKDTGAVNAEEFLDADIVDCRGRK